MEAMLGVSDLIPVGKGRYAIELALRAACIGQGDEVIIPTFCCRTVLPPIHAVGAQPVFADVDANLSLDMISTMRVLSPHTRAVLVPHLFGNPVDIEQFVRLCAQKRLLLIDDACQALGSTFRGKPSGLAGDFGVWSFGYGKITFGAAGSFLYVKDPIMRAKARDILRSWPMPKNVMRRALKVPITRQWARWTEPLYRRLPTKTSREDLTRHYRPEQMANVDAVIALDLMRNLAQKFAARRMHAMYYHKQLATLHPPLRLIPQVEGSSYNSLVLSCGTGKEGTQNSLDLRKYLRERGRFIDNSYTLLHKAEQNESLTIQFPIADSLCSGLVELPVEPTVSMSYIKKLCSSIVEWQSSAKTAQSIRSVT